MSKKTQIFAMAALVTAGGLLAGYTCYQSKKSEQIRATFNKANTCRIVAANMARHVTENNGYPEDNEMTQTKRMCTGEEMNALGDVRTSLDAEGEDSPYYTQAKAAGWTIR